VRRDEWGVHLSNVARIPTLSRVGHALQDQWCANVDDPVNHLACSRDRERYLHTSTQLEYNTRRTLTTLSYSCSTASLCTTSSLSHHPAIPLVRLPVPFAELSGMWVFVQSPGDSVDGRRKVRSSECVPRIKNSSLKHNEKKSRRTRQTV
jgi:hypothetical protein